MFAGAIVGKLVGVLVAKPAAHPRYKKPVVFAHRHKALELHPRIEHKRHNADRFHRGKLRAGPDRHISVGVVFVDPHLLLALLHNRGLTLYRSALLELVWGMDAEPSNRTLDIHMSRLRRKLGWDDRIRTVPRVGYMLEEEETP